MNKKTLITGVIIIMMFFISCSGTRPTSIGVNNGRLAPCSTKPNCVSSQSQDTKHFIEPLLYSTQKTLALKTLKQILSTQPSVTIVEETKDYFYAEFQSKAFGFVDDVEFYLPEGEPLIHIRSASRLGYSDLGVNRKRMEKIRVLFTAALKDK